MMMSMESVGGMRSEVIGEKLPHCQFRHDLTSDPIRVSAVGSRLSYYTWPDEHFLSAPVCGLSFTLTSLEDLCVCDPECDVCED
jgi:hypothetical protein